MDDKNKLYLTADDVSTSLGISKGKAYAIIRTLNEDLKSKGYITVSGKVPKAYFASKYYGFVTA